MSDYELIAPEDDPGGKVERINGETYWMGSKVLPCPMCGIAPTNVDDCGQFGNAMCPAFGTGNPDDSWPEFSDGGSTDDE